MPPLKPESSKSARSALGAPSQHNQPSRKGKKAWRKNVDLQEVEAGIEELRAEERATGTFLHKQQDDQLFVVDVKGDEKIRTKLPKFKSSELTSTKILAQRSAVPAVTSRPAVKKRKSPLSYEDKDRLLRISKRPRKGPFNSVVDPTEFGAGSAAFELTEAVKSSGAYDPWAPAGPVEDIKDGLETVQPKKVKELLLKAHGIEEKRVEKAAKLAETKEKIDQATVEAGDETPGVPAGMKLDEPVPIDIDEDEVASAEVISKKMPERKTKAQRNKAARVLAQKKRAKNPKTALINSGVSLLRRTANKTLSARAIAQETRRAAVEENLKRRGLAGQKLGRHTVPEGEVDVQLGEDLSESLRGLKPEGNLFRDRFTSLQQRALIEPGPKRRKLRIIEYEKHAWKRFDRE
ncbi:ribosome biogenesis protein Nop53/GLTSCR2 [Mycena olivaceomarginata]|nr:ribosome biogenesis protein Nop53/GLTSCR2 [Mycena olivaceomarginata]